MVRELDSKVIESVYQTFKEEVTLIISNYSQVAEIAYRGRNISRNLLHHIGLMIS